MKRSRYWIAALALSMAVGCSKKDLGQIAANPPPAGTPAGGSPTTTPETPRDYSIEGTWIGETSNVRLTVQNDRFTLVNGYEWNTGMIWHYGNSVIMLTDNGEYREYTVQCIDAENLELYSEHEGVSVFRRENT